MFFARDGDPLRVREAERLAIAEMNGNSRVAYIGASADRAQSIVHNERLRHALIKDVNLRSVVKQRCMA
jgi:hypothetical protein